jgi:hypothetical protein
MRCAGLNVNESARTLKELLVGSVVLADFESLGRKPRQTQAKTDTTPDTHALHLK